ncbi:MAG: hypothetical protein IJU57_05380 [Clostridia bacterium]|nr:hypothetical protein [Clostridia bacterium]
MRNVLKKAAISLILAALLAVSGSVPVSTSGDTGSGRDVLSQELRIISMNVSCDMQNISQRSGKMVDLLLSYSPDSIGTQENGLIFGGQWPSVFRTGLTDYSRVGIGDSDPLTKNSLMANYIYYDHTKYDLVDWDSVFLPSLRRLREISWSTNARTATWAVLRNKETGFTYVHLNTHLAFESDEENRFQMAVVAKMAGQLASTGCPVFVSGDYNTSENSESYRIMISEPGIGDPKHLADRTENKGTFRGWGYRNLDGGAPIDFIFVSEESMHVNEYSVIDTYVDGVALTDHCGIFIDVEASDNSGISEPAPGSLSLAGVKVSDESVRTYVYEFEFTQPDDIGNIFRYVIELRDARGRSADSRSVFSYLLDGSCETVRKCTFTCLEPDTEYRISIFGESIEGSRSDPLTFTFRTRPE